MLNDLASAGLQNEIAFTVEFQAVSSVKRNPDLSRISAGSQTKVIFKLSLLPVIDHVNARIDASVSHLSKRRNVGVLSASIIADQIIALALQRLKTYNLWPGLRALEVH